MIKPAAPYNGSQLVKIKSTTTSDWCWFNLREDYVDTLGINSVRFSISSNQRSQTTLGLQPPSATSTTSSTAMLPTQQTTSSTSASSLPSPSNANTSDGGLGTGSKVGIGVGVGVGVVALVGCNVLAWVVYRRRHGEKGKADQRTPNMSHYYPKADVVGLHEMGSQRPPQELP